jgi:hypothetical protein
MKAKLFERPLASLQIAPLATFGFIIGLLLMGVGGLQAPFGSLMWFGVMMWLTAGFFLYYRESEINKRLAAIIASRLGH